MIGLVTIIISKLLQYLRLCNFVKISLFPRHFLILAVLVMEQHKLPIQDTGQAAVHVLYYLIPNLNQYRNRFYITIHENVQAVPAVTSTEYMIEALQEKQRNSNSVIVTGKQ